ncbi:DsbA family protein [Microbacterium excoecariae]|uniref:DsbA family protein n=1 Tax=Microbacterium excoecariae TaxID=2715210 RepID=UPI00140A2654|nr:thioredoxin domain-containing protein [Microbacterium excoecariae]NHI17758.1 DsbA family protein [Microbacterium excoecariae]
MATAGKKSNGFAIVISVIVVVAVVAVGGLVVWMNNAASAPAEAPAAGIINEDTGAIAIGDGDQTVDEYVDLMCPYCNQAFEAYSDTVTELVESGEITLNIHPISILDNASQGTQFSTRAASAAYCVAEDNGDAVYPFFDLMYRNQPAEATEGMTDDEIAGYAADAGAEGAADCIANGEYMDYVTQMTQETPIQEGASGISTPTVAVNGELISVTMDPQTDIVANLD